MQFQLKANIDPIEHQQLRVFLIVSIRETDLATKLFGRTVHPLLSP